MDKQDCSHIIAEIVFEIFGKLDETERSALAKTLYRVYAGMETPVSGKVISFKGYCSGRRKM